MNNVDKYKNYFTKEYLMGPNSFRLLNELIERRMQRPMPHNGERGKLL